MLQDVPAMLGSRYRVVERLGRGGMADVYRAEDLVLRRSVAVKVFRGGVEREHHLARFRSEVRTLAALTHPHLVALYDAGGDIAEPWCAMEYVDGGSLADREHALPPAAVARIGEQIAAGLAYVHARGIVHRDVKPSNVLLDSHGDAFLSDFGIARLVDGTRMTQSGLMIGTAAFLSPEQVRGRPAGPRSDVYALGLVLLEALTARREYPGTPVESAVARLNRPPEIPEGLGTDWAELIRDMTADAAEDRLKPETAATRLQAIARRLSGLVLIVPGKGNGKGNGKAIAADVTAGAARAVESVDARPGDTRSSTDTPSSTDPDPGAPAATPATEVGQIGPVGPAGQGSPRAAVPSGVPVPAGVPVVALPSSPEHPRNLLGWLSPRRRRLGALLAGAASVAAVVVALPMVDGARKGTEVVRLDSSASAGTPAAPTHELDGAGDTKLQVRKAPVVALPVPEEDRAAVERPYRVGQGPRAVAGVATTRPARPSRVLRAPSPSPTLTPSSSPSPAASPSPSASPSATESATVDPATPGASDGTSPATSAPPGQTGSPSTSASVTGPNTGSDIATGTGISPLSEALDEILGSSTRAETTTAPPTSASPR